MFVVEAIPRARLDLMRDGGVDDAGDRLRPHASTRGGEPLRCCLRYAEPGEELALLAYRPEGTGGAYREVGPVFVHASPCAGPADGGAYPSAFRDRRQVLRAYDRDGRIADALHSRNVLYGCYSFAIRRADRR
ncbi:MAG TPA: DUF1203 domain-containing protein [Micromonosporaceae bacterium]|nr:DUF1203 domain-containing protein [Micromonosporaceae bacterium]